MKTDTILSAVFSRRSFLGAFGAVAGLATLTACGGTARSETPAPADTGSDASAASDAAEPELSSTDSATASGSSVLVAYFSASGNTRAVAEAIADELGADLFAVTPTDPYTSEDLDYNSSSSRTSLERNQDGLVVELEEVTPANFDAYDTVFVGYPIWWYDAAWPIDGFVSGNDFSGKRVIPFCTSGGSSIGSSASNLAGLAGTGEWLEGERLSAGDTDAARSWASSMVA